MERMTEKNKDGYYYPYCFREDTCSGIGCSDKCNKCDFSYKVCENLGHLEDLQDRLDKEFKGYISMETIINFFIEFYDQEEKAEELAEALLIVNDNVRRYRKWEKLDKQGRLLELPCAVGDMTYWADKNESRVRDFIVKRIEIESDGVFVITSGPVYHANDFGKRVFLAREEAEEALKRMEDGK